MVENQTSTVVTTSPQGHGVVHLSSEQMKETIEQLGLVREFIYHELRDGADYGRVSGCGDKPTLLQPGAQKICLFFNVYPDYEVERQDLGEGHMDYVVKTTLVARGTSLKVGSGVGSCSSMEKKFRYRQQIRVCPKCGADAIRTSKAGGFFCGVRAGGCGASFSASDATILDQKLGLVANEDVADWFNTVLKMAKKRSFVDATLSLSCISEFFTQNLEDRGSPQPIERPLPGVSSRQKAAEQNAAGEEDKPAAAGPDFTRDPSLNWLEHPQVVEYNRRFEEMVSLSQTRDTDREPACRSFIKNEWMKLARERSLEVRPDRIPSEDYASCTGEWESRVLAAMKVQKAENRQPRRAAPSMAAA